MGILLHRQSSYRTEPVTEEYRDVTDNVIGAKTLEYKGFLMVNKVVDPKSIIDSHGGPGIYAQKAEVMMKHKKLLLTEIKAEALAMGANAVVGVRMETSVVAAERRTDSQDLDTELMVSGIAVHFVR